MMNRTKPVVVINNTVPDTEAEVMTEEEVTIEVEETTEVMVVTEVIIEVVEEAVVASKEVTATDIHQDSNNTTTKMLQVIRLKEATKVI